MGVFWARNYFYLPILLGEVAVIVHDVVSPIETDTGNKSPIIPMYGSKMVTKFQNISKEPEKSREIPVGESKNFMPLPMALQNPKPMPDQCGSKRLRLSFFSWKLDLKRETIRIRKVPKRFVFPVNMA